MVVTFVRLKSHVAVLVKGELKMLGGETRALQSTPFQNPGGGRMRVTEEDERRTEILVLCWIVNHQCTV